ncbi:hypothetical protein ZYGM_002201 [Zygosaccharomyces mellis]|uniref:Uncharacterized protein n=1 Tax=Zygosaccharomyces mellis TaxID=42258 RepID=A0A4C2E6J9_9SACH|nr:hypothetical protein ZYGM_002201 [Zygosaccharomyces mellis]
MIFKRVSFITSLILSIHCQKILPASNPTIVEPVAKVDYGDMSLQMINDFVLIIQVFMTCIPSGALAPMLIDFVRMSCLFNMLSTFSLLSLNLLNGWDRLDESRTFKMEMRKTFNSWAENHEKRYWLNENVNWQDIKNWVNVFDVHFDMYVSNYTDIERNNKVNRMICASFNIGQRSLFKMPFEQEICVTKEGVKKLGRNRFSTLPVDTTKNLVKFLINGGFMKTASNPPFYLFRIMETYGDMSIDFLETLREMTSSLQVESEDSLEQTCNFHESENLLMSIRLKRAQAVASLM